MSSAALRKRVIQGLLKDIEEVQFPSVTMMQRVESTLQTEDDLASYADTLVKKVEETRYPSISMLNRIDGVLDQLGQAEQRNRDRAREDGDEEE